MSESLEKLTKLSSQLNTQVVTVLSDQEKNGFEKAFVLATATAELKRLLTSEYMKPMMHLQGSKLGFKTDKDASGGYGEAAVKNCIIEAVLTGVQVVGNQFNIIAGNCYITKEGFKYLLDNTPGLIWEIIPSLPRIKEDKTSAAIVMKICWKLNGNEETREIDFPVRINAGMGADAVVGKATRKARRWLFETITGREIADGDITDVEAKVVSTKINKPEQRITFLINDATTLKELEALEQREDLTEEQLVLIQARKEEIK